MSSMPALMETRQQQSSLPKLPSELAIQITGRLAAISEWPMDDLHALWVTYRRMRRVCRDPKVSRRISVERLADGMAWDDPNSYDTLLPYLAQVGNLEASFITGMHVVFCGPMITPMPLNKNLEHAGAGGHKVMAYVAIVLLYMANGGAGVNDTAKHYMRQAVAMEESVLLAQAGGGGTMLMLRDCFKCRQVATNVIWRGRWCRPLLHVASAPTRANLPCAVENYGAHPQWGRP
ncbi:hypothetical protein C2845_PM11G04370 [Panicum miliaceum]|uniref:F-box protein n=1 Tax=Panicum miliaceum TaxID=4540 RepID=A0A3L6RS15_PANMI|nr:hypothetical protein C2845_PM11G04370 [Panicum miliaceum]